MLDLAVGHFFFRVATRGSNFVVFRRVAGTCYVCDDFKLNAHTTRPTMSFFHQFFVRSELARAIRERRVRATSREFDALRTVGILYDEHPDTDADAIRRFAQQLRREGKRVKLLHFSENTPAEPNGDETIFTKRDLNWRGGIAGREVLDFVAQEFDLLLDLSRGPQNALRYAVAGSQAAFRVGIGVEGPATEHYEMILDPTGSPNTRELLQQIAGFLKKMHQPQ